VNERTALYRLYDADGTLLYVGIAYRIGQRWETHARTQPWWPDVQRQTVEWYPARKDAECAERRAIRTEEPKYNVAHYPELRHAAMSSHYPDSPWVRREQVEVRYQPPSDLRQHTEPRDRVINVLLACLPMRSEHRSTVDFMLRELNATLGELGERVV
jgi:hypothetical protein